MNTDILVVGQDWSDVNYFKRWKGRDCPPGNPTNVRLSRLLEELGVFLLPPEEPQEQLVFFTNIILCLKNGNMQSRIKDEWLTNCCHTFFRPLVDIIQPKIILSLAEGASKAILNQYGIPFAKSASVEKLIKNAPYRLNARTFLFPVYHCGNRVTNQFRSLEKQIADWRNAAEWLRTSRLCEEQSEIHAQGYGHVTG